MTKSKYIETVLGSVDRYHELEVMSCVCSTAPVMLLNTVEFESRNMTRTCGINIIVNTTQLAYLTAG